MKLDKQYVDTFADLMINNDLFDNTGNSKLSPETLGAMKYAYYVKIFWVNLIYATKDKAPESLPELLSFVSTLKVLPDPDLKAMKVELITN